MTEASKSSLRGACPASTGCQPDARQAHRVSNYPIFNYDRLSIKQL